MMKLLSLGSFKDNPTDPSTHSWPWTLYCKQPRTLSFRDGEGIFRTVDSASKLEPFESRRRRQLLVSMGREEDDSVLSQDDDVAIKTAVTTARLERRLFFNPEETSSILESGEVKESECHASFIEASVAVSMDSGDPYMDFRRSMGEMVTAHSLKGKSDQLEELVCWYLKANDKANHGYIVAAFVDLLVTIQASVEDCSSSANVPPQCYNLTQSPSSPLSFYSSSTSHSCCSSSTSSSTPCHVSAIESTEESTGSSSESAVAAAPAIVAVNCCRIDR